MPDKWEALVAAMKALTRDGETLPVAENEWNTRPNAEAWGEIALEFEAGALNGDDSKTDRAFEGSADLYCVDKRGGGWIAPIEATLTAFCGCAWKLNHHAYEPATRLFHWEWAFQLEG